MADAGPDDGVGEVVDGRSLLVGLGIQMKMVMSLQAMNLGLYIY